MRPRPIFPCCYFAAIALFFLTPCLLQADTLPADVEGQPLASNVKRVLEALDFLGAAPFVPEEKAKIEAAIEARDATALQELLAPHVLLEVHLNPESRVKVERGEAEAVLQQVGHTPFLVRVRNEAHVTSLLRISSPEGGKVYSGAAEGSLARQERLDLVKDENTKEESDRFLSVYMFRERPMTPTLSGLEVEYAICLISSEEAGKREATIAFDVGDGTQDLGFRGEVPVLFTVNPSVPVTFRIRDENGEPTTARLVVQDPLGRVYPRQAKRVAPDLFFQKQIYRADGGVVHLPPGRFSLEASRGPEYRVQRSLLVVPVESTKPIEVSVNLQRWVDPMEHGYYSGDHHIHASGCSHYQFPSVGVDPIDIFPHVKGEGLNVGCILTWGPGFDHQRQFFRAQRDPVSEPLTLIKYDLEISGFGSAALGHVCLLNLKDDNYPGSEGTSKIGWPTWTIPVMRWCKEQGGIAGYAHSASGLHVEPELEAKRLIENFDADKDTRISREEAAGELLPEDFDRIDRSRDGWLDETELTASLQRAAETLPNLAIPGMNGAGAMEIAISTVEGVCDFISAMDTARIQEWNTWYHIMNCGHSVKVSGETDFPCMSGTRVGQGRVYVQLGDIEEVRYTDWCEGLAKGRSYVSDGYAHALQFQVNEVSPGFGDVNLEEPGTVKVKALVSFSPETPIGVPYGTADPPKGKSVVGDTVHLHIGHNDDVVVGGERKIEVVMNGQVIATKEVPSDGQPHELTFDVHVGQSSWIALRQFPQLHTNPVNVIVADEPIRTSKDSARWCIEMIEKLWVNREKKISEPERAAARESYDRALEYYRAIVEE